MKNEHKSTIIPHLRTWLLTLTVIILSVTEAAAQKYVVFTNGTSQLWLEHDTENPILDPIGYLCTANCDDPNNRVTSGPITKSIITPSDTTIWNTIGSKYLELAIDSEDPTNASVQVATDFSQRCLWIYKSAEKYYYQVEGDYYYYLRATSERGVYVEVHGKTDGLYGMTRWNDWDFGAAIEESSKYYWLSLNRDGDEWVMSCNSYNRPETPLYLDIDNLTDISYYCPTMVDADVVPAYYAAQTSPVKMRRYESDLMAEPYGGFTSVEIDYADGVSLKHKAPNNTATVKLNYYFNPSKPPLAYTMRPHTEYIVETECRGMNLNWRKRGTAGFGGAGDVDSMVYYYFDDGTSHAGFIEYGDLWQEVDLYQGDVVKIEYNLDRTTLHYASFDNGTPYGTNSLTYRNPAGCDLDTTVTIICHSMPIDMVGTLTVTVTYTSGVTQVKTTTIQLSQNFEGRVRTQPEHGPLVKGNVVGGGRMAAVNGNTNVTVHNCDTITAVYGGNDIAGWVRDTATVQIGSLTTGTDAEYGDGKKEVHIGRVYGGGCGLYRYEGLHFDDDTIDPSRTGEVLYNEYLASTAALPYYSYWFAGRVYPWDYRPEGGVFDSSKAVEDHIFDFTPKSVAGCDWHIDLCEDGLGGDGTVPYIYAANITVGITASDLEDPSDNTAAHNDYVHIDSLFGGAENSFIGITASEGSALNAATIDINGGTVFAVFGGNNYGGAMAHSATSIININGTKMPGNDEPTPIVNTLYSKYGRDYGIRYVFGGGNLVENSFSNVNIRGGMVDTVFGGGNRASVLRPMVTVDCRGTDFVYSNPQFPDLDLDEYQANPQSILNHLDGYIDEGFVVERGKYNVRSLFGGNNRADMDSVSLINLYSGGLGVVYGGGNAGAMNYTGTLPRRIQMVLNSPDDPELPGIGFMDGSMVPTPTTVSSLVYATQYSTVLADQVYGGCRMSDVKGSCGVRLSGGTYGYLIGGCDVSGHVGGEGSYVMIDSNVVVLQDAYGGSDGFYHCLDEEGYYKDGSAMLNYADEPYDLYGDYIGMKAPTHNSTNLLMKNGTVVGNIYGGAVLTYVGDRITRDGSVHLEMTGGRVMNNVFGGGYLSSVYGNGYVHVGGTSRVDGAVFAANDFLGSIQTFTPFELPHLGAEYMKETFKSSDGANLNHYDGGSWTANFDSYLLIDGTPTIHLAYGSGNGAYDYDGTRPEYESYPICIDEGGNNRPLQKSTFVDIHTNGGYIDTVFGGGDGVGVNENVTVLFNATSVTNPDSTHGRFVGTIFGGNNRENMESCVPMVNLVQGTVGNVYGGSNMGNMNGMTTKEDICGNPLTNVSTYVLLNSDKVTVTDEVYGGCNKADVAGMAFVDIRTTSQPESGTPYGVGTVYGGNNMAGTVGGNTRIDVSGGYVHNIYGGSNGHYDYVEFPDTTYIYTYGSAHNDEDILGTFSSGRPKVNNTQVNIMGGHLMNNVYGGGRMGTCDSTHVMINDQLCGNEPAYIQGIIYGGGQGDDDNLNAEHVGNVLHRSYVDLWHAENVDNAKAYGGGRGGDVNDTWITVHEEWDEPFNEIYGGCWGSDVTGTAHVVLHGRTDISGYNIENVFGGNDFTGNVYKSEVDVYSGTYAYIYGAGNGNYAASAYTAAPTYSDAGNALYLPNNEYVEINMYDGLVRNNMYGGGRYGTMFCYMKDSDGNYILGSDGRKQADTTFAMGEGREALDYSYTLVNMHGGKVAENIYAGAAGELHGQQLVYGLKMLNMDGGTVGTSIYGGSENVNDGYPGECDTLRNTDPEGTPATLRTTMRPSSIINLTGGIVSNNIYGGSYMGGIYGSCYINVGLEAIDSCPVWEATYDGVPLAYAKFRPGADDGIVEALTKTPLEMSASIYGGANWGTNPGVKFFNSRGFFGGENRIIIDGAGYNTDNDFVNENPYMNLENSIIGAGTSANGGDVLCRIEVRNYGVVGSDCQSSKYIKSIQRANELWLHNTAIRFTGTNDAISSDVSQQYSFNRLDTIYMRGYNVPELEALATNISSLIFYEDSVRTTPRAEGDSHYPFVLVENKPLIEEALADGACDISTLSMCERLAVVSPNDPDKRHTAIFIASNNGLTVQQEVLNDKNEVVDYEYGSVYGFSYLMAPAGNNAVVIARAKILADPSYTYTEEQLLSMNYYDGGFVDPCADESGNNKSVVDGTWSTYNSTTGLWESTNGWTVGWADGTAENIAANPDDYTFAFTNYINSYRVWSVNKGLRRRWGTILAHINPNEQIEDKYLRLENDSLAVAKASVILPPTEPGHYYKIVEHSLILTGENENMVLIDSTWMPDDWDDPDKTPDDWEHVATPGTVIGATFSGTSVHNGLNLLYDSPGNTFGLVMTPGRNFNNEMPSIHASANPWTIISGNSHVNYVDSYCSPLVSGVSSNTTPIMDFYLTYSNTFFSTFLGTVTFKLQEYIMVDGVETLVDDESPIEVNLIISTIIKDFTDMKQEVLAMYNEGRTNRFSRKVVLPATLQHRDLYLTSVKWIPTTSDGRDSVESDKFEFTANESTITGAPEGVINRFGMHVVPSDNISQTMVSSIGWHSIEKDTLNLFSVTNGKATAYPGNDDPRPYSDWHAETIEGVSTVLYDSVSLRDDGRGIKIGELDGRGNAVLNIDLLFDGNRFYEKIDKKGYVGKVIMGLQSYYGDTPIEENGFYITIYVKTREHGDTIYIASADSVARGIGAGRTVLYPFDPEDEHPEDEGKYPSKYVQSFQDALSPRVYQEGDVIAVLDTVKITDNNKITIQGVDYFSIPIIRYFGHNIEAPGEEWVYRGPMLLVDGEDAAFNARAVAFNGSVTGRLNNGDAIELDTNMALAPIMVATNGGTITLGQGVSVMNNWNGYSGDDASSKGVISITEGGILMLGGDVVVADNFSYTYDDDTVGHPFNGAVYIDGGTMTITSSNKASVQTIINNYLLPDDGSTWWTTNTSGTRWMLDNSVIENWDKANVFLTRTEPDTGDDTYKAMNDIESDYLEITSLIPVGSRIGISKWFPGEDIRDTIDLAKQLKGSMSYIEQAFLNGNFVSDDGYNIFFSRLVDGTTVYLHRCATFKQQLADEEVISSPSIIMGKDPLIYTYNPAATCPTGGDSLFYRVQGGFLPYTYTWTGSSTRTRVTKGSNTTINKQLEEGNIDGLASAMVDTLVLPRVSMYYARIDSTVEYTVVATDAAGCRWKKDISINITKRIEGIDTDEDLNPLNYVDTTPLNAWTERDSVVVAKIDRNYNAVRLTPLVWTDRSTTGGVIKATVGSSDSIYTDDPSSRYNLADLRFCEGDVIKLSTATKKNDMKFIMWDFDPFYKQTVNYVVPAHSTDIVAYYGPSSHWIDTITSANEGQAVYATGYYYTGRPNTTYQGTPVAAGYVTTYEGDVHIYNERGLAWFISVVNGINGTQARQFYFNKVFLHKKDAEGTPYDMKDFLWTPVGTHNHPFRGWFVGVSEDATDTVPLSDERVTVRNIIVNEPNMGYTGMFGYIDTARISGIELQGALVRGSQYAGTLAADAIYAHIDNCAVLDSTLTGAATTILTTHYASGGMLGRASHTTVSHATTKAKYVGDAVYSGGIIGEGENDTVNNSWARNDMRMSGLYYGGIAGNMTATDPHIVTSLPNRLFTSHSSSRSSQSKSHIANNYIHIIDNGHAEHAGGVAGYAENTVMENNYVYGRMAATVTDASVAATMANGAVATNNYASHNLNANPAVGATATFQGKGNQVMLDQEVYGTDNMTRALNKWVRNHNSDDTHYNTWRSDLDNVNDGYPIFGTPDLIPVRSVATVTGCDEVWYGNNIYRDGDSTIVHVVDSLEMIDSISVIHFVVHHGSTITYTDSAVVGHDYDGYGFHIPASMSLLIGRTIESSGSATITLQDTLTGQYGCDSIVTLTVTFVQDASVNIETITAAPEIKVYPNPTTTVVTVEAEGLSHVELYDNEGRLLDDYFTTQADRITIDVSGRSSGLYYLRVHTPDNINIQKLIKK